MCVKLSGLMDRMAKGWLILFLTTVFLLYLAITIPVLRTFPGGDIVSLDAKLFYTPEVAFATVASYGSAAGYWIRVYLTWDVINPIMYTLILGLAISWFFQRSFEATGNMRRLNLLPLVAGLADLCENVCIIVLLSSYPARPTALAWLSSGFTLTKMFFVTASILLIVVGAVASSRRRFRRT